LVPDHQGIVHNTMQDAALGAFKVSDQMAVGEGRWWGGEPIWVGAARAGMSSAALFWPGSQADIAGRRPTRWLPYDATMPIDARIDTLAGWLSEGAATRPRIAVMYLETVDEAAHAHGPHSPQAHAAVRRVDAALGRLLAHLDGKGRRRHTNLLVVSDHGMATVPPGRVIAVEDMVPLEEAVVVTVGQVITVAPRRGQDTAVARRLLGAHAQYDCWRKDALPPRWRYGTHPRIPPIVCQMHEGWDALARESIAMRPAHERGSHGYDPESPALRALFVASGPAFRRGATLPPFPNVDVYALLAALLGITPAPHDGDAARLLPALRGDGPVGDDGPD
ncbi:MAG TPA: ectonucleotide pyrophosphatase/phosphodiesterase, partial [Luteimonas sp.]|nr:ectonucleotide pyrophosphatase/phosphodiesterase [Luteimonas sp.]